MIILDLFAGLGGELRRSEIEARGHTYITVDNNPIFKCTITDDVLKLKAQNIGYVDFVWASFPCEAFSVASISHHWYIEQGVRIPKSEHAKYSIDLVIRTLNLIEDLKKINPNLLWLGENPRGMLRKMPFMESIPRTTVTYCQYGETRMKPTDLWGFIPEWNPKQPCKNGDSCHEKAPRGSKSGTQSVRNAAIKSIVPIQLWMEILEALEKTAALLA
jgi:site-specific DNA-cytosine methylase